MATSPRPSALWIACLAVLGCTASASLPRPAASGDWPAYGRDAGGERFSPLAQITRANVARLQVAWRFHTGETSPRYAPRAPTALEATPLVFEGTMYLSTPLARLIALDGATGQRCTGFGARGEIDVRIGLRNPPANSAEYQETSPPTIVNGMVVVGSAIADNNRTDGDEVMRSSLSLCRGASPRAGE